MLHYNNFSKNDIPGEIWVDIEEWEGVYRVSSYARVKTIARMVPYLNARGKHVLRPQKEKILSQYNCEDYLKVSFYHEAIEYKWFVHILVALHFVKNEDNKPVVNHYDGNRKNNLPYNLVWATDLENCRHAIEVLNKKPGTSGLTGKLSPCSRKVIQLSMEGIKIKEWDSISDIKRELNLKSNHVSECCSGKFTHAHGYRWQYK